MTNLATKAIIALTAISIVSTAPAVAEQSMTGLCATDVQKTSIAEAVASRSGAPTMIYARNLGLPELTTVSGLPETTSSYGTAVTPEQVKDIWASIDQWGGDTFTHIVFTMGGDHVADFPSLTPITQPDDDSGFIDIYADNGDGVHGHVFLDLVKAVYAAELPGPDGVTRMVSLYNESGGLIVAMYASIMGKHFDQRAVDGFDKTVEKLKEHAPLCD